MDKKRVINIYIKSITLLIENIVYYNTVNICIIIYMYMFNINGETNECTFDMVFF